MHHVSLALSTNLNLSHLSASLSIIEYKENIIQYAEIISQRIVKCFNCHVVGGFCLRGAFGGKF